MTALKKLLGINRALQQLLNTTPGSSSPEAAPGNPVDVQPEVQNQRKDMESRPAGSGTERK